MNYGSRAIDEALTFYANTHDAATGGAVDADSVPTYRVYENETATPLLTGSMALLDSTNTVGFYSEAITLSAANGFEAGKTYGIYITATVSTVVGTTHHTFQMTAPVNVTHIAGAAVSTSTAQLGVNVVNAAGTAWGSGAITAGAFAANAINAAKLDPDVTTELQAGLATAAALTTVDDFLDTEVAAILAAVDTEVAAIKAKTDNLPAAPAATGDIPTAAAVADAVWDEATLGHTTSGTFGEQVKTDIDAILADTGTDGVVVNTFTTAGKAELQTEAADALTAYDPPTNTELVAEIDAVQADIAALNNISAADVNAQVLDVLTVDTFAELTDVPAATSTLKDKLAWLFMLARNRVTQTSTTLTVYADDGTTALSTSTVSDVAGTFDRGEVTP